MENLEIVRRVSARIPTDLGQFKLNLYTTNIDDKEHLALVMGKVAGEPDILVRVHSECFTGDVLGSRRCDCGDQLQQAMYRISKARKGVILYLRQEGRGIGLIDKLYAYNLQDISYDTVDANLALGYHADERDYTVASLILRDLGVLSIRLLTNNPDKVAHLQQKGIKVNQRLPIEPNINPDNQTYLLTKATRLNHLLSLPAQPGNGRNRS